MTLQEGGRDLELRILEELGKRISVYGDDSVVRHEETSRGGVDILTAEFTDFGEHKDTVAGEFLFREVEGDPDGGKYFCSVITLTNDIPLDNVPELSYAVSMINFYIESGCFALNKPSDMLVYRSTRIFSGDTPEDRILKDCMLEMEEAYDIAAKYCVIVFALAEGSLPLEDFMELLVT